MNDDKTQKLNETMLEAVYLDDVSTLQKCINNNGNINAIYEVGESLLHVAAQTGALKCLQHLLKCNLNINATDRYGNTPIHEAVLNNHFEAFLTLKNANADLNRQNNQGETPLHLAAFNGNFNFLNSLITSKINLDTKTKKGRSPLYNAVAGGHLNIVDCLLTHHAQPDETLALAACRHGHFDLLPALAARGIDINTQMTRLKNGVSSDRKQYWNLFTQMSQNKKLYKGFHFEAANSALHTEVKNQAKKQLSPTAQKELNERLQDCIYSKNITAFKQLHKQGADLNALNSSSQTPAHTAALFGDIRILHYIAQNNGSLNTPDTWGEKPIHSAAQSGHVSALKCLLHYHIDINETNNQGQSPLHIAAQNGNMQAVVFLCTRQANLNLADKAKRTPLDYAAMYNHPDILNYLIHQKAEIQKTDIWGQTPAHLAAQCNAANCFIALNNANIDLKAKDNNGLSAFAIAHSFQNHKIAQALVDFGFGVQEVTTPLSCPPLLRQLLSVSLVAKTLLTHALIKETSIQQQTAIHKIIKHNTPADKVFIQFIREIGT